MSSFLHNLPEQAENPMPPSLPGEMLAPSKLRMLRRRQLLDVATAYGVELPSRDLPKERLLVYLIQAEEAGRLRGKPASPYHLKHAEISHDRKLSERDANQFDRELTALEEREFSRPALRPVDIVDNGQSLEKLQAEAAEYGIPFEGKTRKMLLRDLAERR